MIFRMKCVVLLICLTALAGCGPKTRYAWNDYDSALYSHYKTPAEKQEFIVAMKEIVDDAEGENKVPPGIYAEYGYLMYEKGDMEQAVLYYQKEASKWPESKFLMEKMITNTQKRQAKNGGDSKPVTEQTPATTQKSDAAALVRDTADKTTTSTPPKSEDETASVEVLK